MSTTQQSPLPPSLIPPWQQTYRARLEERQRVDGSHAKIIQAYRELALCLRDARERNDAWMRGAGEGGGGGGLALGGEGPSKQYILTLEKQLSHLRSSLSDSYRSRTTQSDKLLKMNDVLREREEELRRVKEEVRGLREGKERWGRREREWEERWRVKEGDAQHLQDELLSLHLELDQLSQRNTALQADNAALLQRWLDKMNERVDWMNGEFEKESGSGGGKEVGEGGGGGAVKKE